MSVMFLPEGRAAAIRDSALPRRNGMGLTGRLRAGWAALAAWQDRRRAILCLRQMTDTQLRDLGITRLDVERVVRGEPVTGNRPGGRG
jgi:uncharacterized protein YjiS (DUF1127 family)